MTTQTKYRKYEGESAYYSMSSRMYSAGFADDSHLRSLGGHGSGGGGGGRSLGSTQGFGPKTYDPYNILNPNRNGVNVKSQASYARDIFGVVDFSQQVEKSNSTYSDFYNNPSKYEINPITGEPTGFGAIHPGDDPMYDAILFFADTKATELVIMGVKQLAPKVMAAVSSIFFKGSKVATETVCFVSGTLILTRNGLKAIDSITTKDSVWTYNVETKTTELNTVPNIFKRSSFEFVRIWYGGDSVTCTPEHPFFENNSWVAAKDLKQGDSLFAFSGVKLRIDSLYQFKTDTATAVYNLEASGNHNYYVSESGVLVHNCNTAIKPLIEYSVHASQQMAKRGITQKMVEATMRKGTKYWDPDGGTYVYYLSGASAKGKDMMVAVSGANPNRIVTTNMGWTKSLFKKRWIPIKK